MTKKLLEVLALTGVMCLSLSSWAQLTVVGVDFLSNPESQHATVVEPAAEAGPGSAGVLTAYQMGRFYDGGAAVIGFSFSSQGGAFGTWSEGGLPGITRFMGGPYDRASDPSVASAWARGYSLISTLAIMEIPPGGEPHGVAVLTSRSSDGLNWSLPVVVATGTDLDKNWIDCWNFAQLGISRCYTFWTDAGDGYKIKGSVSQDAGATWSPPRGTVDNARGTGVMPILYGSRLNPVAVYWDIFDNSIKSFTVGGQSIDDYGPSIPIATVASHPPAGRLRALPIPSGRKGQDATTYVVWYDCRFRAGCVANDIVMSSSSDGVTWSPVVRLPIHSVTGPEDHFLPSIEAVGFGSTASLAVSFYYYPVANCTETTCALIPAIVFSSDAGATWSTPIDLSGPINLTWLADTGQGRMVGDYFAVRYTGGSPPAMHAFAVSANMPSTQFSEFLGFSTVLPPPGATSVAVGKDPVLYLPEGKPVTLPVTLR